jgi:adenylate cyclase
MNMATLYQIGEDGSREERCEIGEAPVVVGRNGRAQVSVKDDGMSRRHFCIVRDGEDYVIKDLNSRNGTWVEGRRVFAERLRHNDRILAGRTEFVFADPPVVPMSGPHGTQILEPRRSLENSLADSGSWQEAFAPAPAGEPAQPANA